MTRTQTGGAAAPRTTDGDGDGEGATVAGDEVRPDSGRGGTVADGAGSVAVVAVRTAPASPAHYRPSTRSTRCPCGSLPADRRPRSIPFPSLYNLQKQF